jgi:beta-lactamase regulating signal transducer with metallopeptidase domain
VSFASASTGPASLVVLATDLAAKVTALLVIGLFAQQVLARWRAALGATVGNACLIGLCLVPFSALALPAVNVACLPAVTFGDESRPRPLLSVPDSRPLHFAVDDLSDAPIDGRPAVVLAPARNITAGSTADASHSPALAVSDASAPDAASGRSSTINWVMLGLIGYAIVAVFLMVRLLAGLLAVARLRDASPHVVDGPWWLALERCRGRLGIDRPVGLAWSPRVGVPVVLGWMRPTIVLPASFRGMDASVHAGAVFLHELTHVRRRDYPWNVFLRLVQAVYWPHPLVWLLGRAIAETRERACDDLCVHELGGPAAYRETLVAVAQGMSHRASPALGLAMARPSRLGQRLARIEESRGDARCVPSVLASWLIVAPAVATAVALGTIQLRRAEARPIAPLAASQESKLGEPALRQDGAGRVFHLRVVAAGTDEPVPNAVVRVSIAFHDEWRKTDALGHLDIVHSTGPADREFGIDLWGEGRAMQRHHWGLNANQPIPDGATVRLEPGESLGGIVQDERGWPIAGATVFLWSHNYRNRGSGSHELLYDLRAITGSDGRWRTSGAPATTGELLGIRIEHRDYVSSRDYHDEKTIPKIADLRADKAVTVMKKGVPIEGRVVDTGGKPVAGARVLSMGDERAMYASIKQFAVFTDADGRFRTWQVKPGQWFLVASAAGHGPGDLRVTVGAAVQQVEIALGRRQTFKGRVVDPDGKPIAGAFVDPDVWKGTYRCLGIHLWTDTDGRFRWDDAPNDELIVNVNKAGYRGLSQEPVAPLTEDVVFRLEPSLRIVGKVRDAATKKPVENATVDYGEVDPATGQASRWTGMPELGMSTGIFRGRLDINFPVTADAYQFRVQSPGFLPFVSRTFKREEKQVMDYDVALVPGTAKPTAGLATAFGINGIPLAGARVYEIQHLGNITIEDGVGNVWQGRKCREYRTGLDGSFSIPQSDEPWFIFILGDGSYVSVDKKSLGNSLRVQAKRYAHIEGEYRIGSRIAPNRELELWGMIRHTESSASIFFSQRVTTDPKGRFTFKDVVPAAGLRIARSNRGGAARGAWSIGESVHVESGKTAQVVLGGKGRPVIGRVEPPSGWTKPLDFSNRSAARIEINRRLTPDPLDLLRGRTSLAGADLTAWRKRWRESAEGLEYANSRVSSGVPLEADGSFRIDDVPAGEYRLAVTVNRATVFHVAVMTRLDPGPFPNIVQIFSVPPVPDGHNDLPIDLGVLRLNSRVTLEVGRPAPGFKITTVAGKTLSVPEDFRGKFLLIDFGTSWDIEASSQLTELNDVYQKFGRDARLAILSLTFAPETAETRKWIDDKGEPWAQAIVGPLSNPISVAYAIDDTNVSTSILIGPDGTIVAKDLWRARIGEAVGEALGRAGR